MLQPLVLQSSMPMSPCPGPHPAWLAFHLKRTSLRLLPSQATIISLCFPSFPSALERVLYACHLHFLTTHSLVNPFQRGPLLDSSLIGHPPEPNCQTQQPLLSLSLTPALAASDTGDHMSVALFIYTLPDSKKEKRWLTATHKMGWESIGSN